MKLKLALTIASFSALFLFCADYELLNNGEKPPKAIPAVSKVYDTTITISWSQCADINFKTYQIFYNTDETVDQGKTFADSILIAADTVKTIRGLKPATTYYFRVLTTLQQATFSWSDVLSATTWLHWNPPLWVGDSAQLLQWTRLTNSAADKYIVFRDTTDKVDSSKTPVDTILSSDSSTTLSNLVAGKSYRYKVYAKFDTAFVATSNFVAVRGWWINLFPPNRTADTAVTLKWQKVPSGISKYWVFYGTQKADTLDTAHSIIVTDTTAIIGKLNPNIAYQFRVYGLNATSGPRFAAWSSQKCLQLTSSAVVLKDSANKDSTVILSWTKNTDQNFIGYQVFYDTTGNVDTTDMHSYLLTNNTIMTTTVKHLKPSTLYNFRVFVFEQGIAATGSNIVSVVTGLLPLKVSMPNPGDSCVRINCTPVNSTANYKYDLQSFSGKNLDSLDSTITKFSSDSTWILKNIHVGTTKKIHICLKGPGLLDTARLSQTPDTTIQGWSFTLNTPLLNSDSTGVKLTWEKVQDASSYIVYYDSNAIIDFKNCPRDTLIASDTTHPIPLPSGQLYTFLICAQNNGKPFAWSMPKQFPIPKKQTTGK